MDIRIVDLPEQQTAVMREQVAMNALPGFFDRAFGAVSAAMEAQAWFLPVAAIDQVRYERAVIST